MEKVYPDFFELSQTFCRDAGAGPRKAGNVPASDIDGVDTASRECGFRGRKFRQGSKTLFRLPENVPDKPAAWAALFFFSCLKLSKWSHMELKEKTLNLSDFVQDSHLERFCKMLPDIFWHFVGKSDVMNFVQMQTCRTHICQYRVLYAAGAMSVGVEG